MLGRSCVLYAVCSKLCFFSNLLGDLTLPYLTKSNKEAYLLLLARSVFDDVINQMHIVSVI